MRCIATLCIKFSAIKKEKATTVLYDQWKANSPACVLFHNSHIHWCVSSIRARMEREKIWFSVCWYNARRDRNCLCCNQTCVFFSRLVAILVVDVVYACARTHAHSRSPLEHFVCHVLAESKSAKAVTVRTFTSLSFRSFLDYVHMVKYR